jgi:hypothetical protein
LFGVVFIAGGFFDAINGESSRAQILGYAIVFGVGQEVVTCSADRKASQLMAPAESKST